MVSKACSSRLQKEHRALLKDPPPGIEAHPSPNNLLEWHYIVCGPSDSPYEGGIYHGKLIFPPEYPFKAPSLTMMTPSGRFEPNAKICMSMTDFHPELWQPLWSVGTILTGLLSFMLEEAPTTGSVTSTTEQKRQLAAASLQFNVKNAQFRKLFAWVEEEQRRRQDMQRASPAAASSPAVNGSHSRETRRPHDPAAGISRRQLAGGCCCLVAALFSCWLYSWLHSH